MPRWIHRTTKQVLVSVALDDLPEPVENYIEEPDLSAVEGYPVRYWVITADDVNLMSQAERDAVDAQLLSDVRDSNVQMHVDDLESIVRRVVVLLVDENNFLRQWITSFKAEVAAASSLAQLKSGVASLPDTPDRTLAQARNAIRNGLGS